ncbi:MAG TPA: hypothetical protein DD745_09815 [Bacteroidales bacterium]|nr:hypothetical protein [Bacteroidales bacterium]
MKEATQITFEICTLIEKWVPRLTSLSEQSITEPRNNRLRNIKQIPGHLIDSTSNNTHRVVHLQYQKSPFSFPNYATFGNNDRWIAIQNYEVADWNNMIQLWKYSLLHLCHVINNVNDENWKMSGFQVPKKI